MEEGGWNSGEVKWNEKKKMSAEEEDAGIGGPQRMENEESDGLQRRKMKMIGFCRGWKKTEEGSDWNCELWSGRGIVFL